MQLSTLGSLKAAEPSLLFQPAYSLFEPTHAAERTVPGVSSCSKNESLRGHAPCYNQSSMLVTSVSIQGV